MESEGEEAPTGAFVTLCRELVRKVLGGQNRGPAVNQVKPNLLDTLSTELQDFSRFVGEVNDPARA